MGHSRKVENRRNLNVRSFSVADHTTGEIDLGDLFSDRKAIDRWRFQ